MNLLLVTNANLNSLECSSVARALAEFGDLYILSTVEGELAREPDLVSLVESRLPALQRRYPGATFYQVCGVGLVAGVQLALTTPDWLPQMNLVVLAEACHTCFGAEAWASAQTQAAMLAYNLGIPAFSFVQPVATWQHWETLGYAAERLIRAFFQSDKQPHVMLKISVPNIRPNECEGFALVQADCSSHEIGHLDRTLTPWAIRPMRTRDEEPIAGTDRWAVSKRQVAVVPSWGWRPSNLAEQLETISILSTLLAQMGSSRAYRAAVDRVLNHEVTYNYHFKGAVFSAQTGFCTRHAAAPFAFDVDPVIEEPILEHASGRVLDVGCGPGRIAIYLIKERREVVTEVVGIDSSPASLEDYERRWTREVSAPCITRCLDLRTDTLESLGQFNTIVMLGDTLGIPGNRRGLIRLFRALRHHVYPGGKLIASGRDPAQMTNIDEQRINADNMSAGFEPGERHLRISFEHHDTGWFPWYYAGLDELRDIGSTTGWTLLEPHTRWREPDRYGVVLEAIQVPLQETGHGGEDEP